MRFFAGVMAATLDFLPLTRTVFMKKSNIKFTRKLDCLSFFSRNIMGFCESDTSRRNHCLLLKLLGYSNDYKNYLWTEFQIKIRFFINTVPIVKSSI